MRRITLEIARIRLQADLPAGYSGEPERRHRHFLLNPTAAAKEDARIHIRYTFSFPEPGDFPAQIREARYGSCHWKVFAYPKWTVIYLFFPDQQDPTILFFEHSTVPSEIWVRPSSPHEPLLRYPTDLIILLCLAPAYDLLICHACGFLLDQQGWIGTGRSGSGKSTLCSLAQSCQGTRIQDDRLIIRKEKTSWWMYPLPLQDSDRPVRSPIHHLMNLSHARENQLLRLAADQQPDALLPHIIHFPFHPTCPSHALVMARQFLQAHDIHAFAFQPDRSAIRHLLTSQPVSQGHSQPAEQESPSEVNRKRNQHGTCADARISDHH